MTKMIKGSNLLLKVEKIATLSTLCFYNFIN